MGRTLLVIVVACTAGLTAGAASADPAVNECTSLRLKGTCRPASGGTTVSRTKKLDGEKTITTKITIEQPVMQQKDRCEADVSITYVQMNDRFRVDAEIDSDDCESAHGQYTIRARTIGNGVARTREFHETWERHDGSKIAARHEYDMDGDTRLMWVNIKTRPKTACKCLREAAPASE